MLKLFEAFSGYGSQSLALTMLGIPYKNVGISEIDKYAIEAHRALHGDVKNYGDISKIDTDDLPEIDLFTYSFPCTDISLAGRRKGLERGSGTRSSLLWECERLIESKRPKYLMMENVKALLNKDNKSNFEKWLDILSEFGYNSYYKVLNAKDYGIPQNRERVFCVSILNDYDNGTFKFEEPFESGLSLCDLLDSVVDESYYVKDIRLERILGSLREQEHKEHKKSNHLIFIGGISSRDWIGDGKHLSRNYPQGMRIYDSKGIASALTAQGVGGLGGYSGMYLDSSLNVRKLTCIECFRLMGLTDEQIYKIQSLWLSNTQQYKLAGNSIVVQQMSFLKNIPFIY